MAVRTEWLTAQTSDGPMRVYVAYPEGPGPHPAVLVLQEIYGVTDDIRLTTRNIAEGGFVGAAPEVYHRDGVGETSDRDVASQLGEDMKYEWVIEDCLATVDLLNSLPEVKRGAIGMTGFCSGGRYCYLMAARTKGSILAYAPFYATRVGAAGPDALVNETAGITDPMVLFFGEKDQHIPVEHAERIRAKLTELGKDFELYIYPGAGHAFYRNRHETEENARGAEDAWARTLAFFREKLGQAAPTEPEAAAAGT